MKSRSRRASLGRWLPLVALAGLTAFAVSQGWHRHLSLTVLAEHHEILKEVVGRNRAAALAGFVAVYAGATALSLPGGAVLTVAGGFLFGWLPGGFATLIGATAGAAFVFLIARTAFAEPLRRAAGPRLERLQEGFRRDAFNYLLFLRLVPAFPFWLVNLAPALFNVPLRTFVLATVVGIVPGVIVFSSIGAGLESVIHAERAAYDACVAAQGAGACRFELHLKTLVSPGLLAALAALGLFALLPVLVKKLKRSGG